MHDQVYGALVFGGAEHVHPVNLVPEAAPWVISLDAISKTFASTGGCRVGWVLAAPPVIARMASLIGHVGAWAPRPEQVAVAKFPARYDRGGHVSSRYEHACVAALGSAAARRRGFARPGDIRWTALRRKGAIYLSLRLDLVGRRHRGQLLADNEASAACCWKPPASPSCRSKPSACARETGWFRLSVGAVSVEDIDAAFPRLRTVLAEIE